MGHSGPVFCSSSIDSSNSKLDGHVCDMIVTFLKIIFQNKKERKYSILSFCQKKLTSWIQKILSPFFRVLLAGINQYSFDLEDKEKENKTKQGGTKEFRARF